MNHLYIKDIKPEEENQNEGAIDETLNQEQEEKLKTVLEPLIAVIKNDKE